MSHGSQPGILTRRVLFQASETDMKSTNMELQGLIRTLEDLAEKLGIDVHTLVTDRHKSIVKWMNDNRPLLRHQ